MIYCRLLNRENVYYVIATQKNKTITLAVKDKLSDAKELAFALFELGKVDNVEVEGLLVL